MKMKYFVLVISVIALLGCKKNNDSVLQEITLQNEPPLSFNLMEVADGSTDVDVVPTLSWASAKNPNGTEVTYELYLGKETNPTTVHKSGISNTSFQIEDRLNLISDYYWKVVAKDAEGRSSQSPINRFTTRNIIFPKEPSALGAELPKRLDHTALSHEGKLWVFAGDKYGGFLADVWQSPDGHEWTEIGDSPLLEPRFGHSSVVHSGHVWVLGGRTQTGEALIYTHDVLSSIDGFTWTDRTDDTNFFPARIYHTSVVFNDKIFVIGGRSDDGLMNDIWQYDGTWSQVMVNSQIFSERAGHSTFVFDDKIWVIGGQDISGQKNDVWYSSNGSDWTLVTPEGGFPPISNHRSVIYGGKMWIIGLPSQNNHYWYSENGVDWLAVELPEARYPNYGQTATVHKEKLYLIGGIIDEMEEEVVNDVWILE